MFSLTALLLFPTVATLSWDVLHPGEDPDHGKDMLQIVRDKRYPIEEHHIETEDGYVLTIFRIPHGLGSNQVGAPVLVQHALLCSSFDWVNNPANESLAFVLADAGFDVWLGNNRGGPWGRSHTSLETDSEEFWDFTIDHMALFDLPAHVDYVLRATGQPSLSYIGHSEGTIQAFAGFSRNSTLSSKVNLFVAFAPMAYAHHQTSFVFGALAYLDVSQLFEMFGMHEFLPQGGVLNKVAPGICGPLGTLCANSIELFCGKSHDLNATRMPIYLAQTPAGTSVKNMAHWAQLIKHDRFAMWDFGSKEDNMRHYGEEGPPGYKLSDLTVPTALYTGGLDILSNPRDVQKLIYELPTTTLIHHKVIDSYAHLDFSWGQEAARLLYPDVIAQLKAHRGDDFQV